MTKVEAATTWMEDLANDDSHGYSWGGWGPQDYDCGHAIITAWQQAGVPVKDLGATYTGNMRDAFLRAGVRDVTGSVNLRTGGGLQRGDVLLNEANHAAMYVGFGKLVHARGSDGHPEPGDQGREICIQPYFNFPWDAVLRYPETVQYDPDADEQIPDYSPAQDTGKTGLLVDGECGPETWAALGRRMPIIRRGSKGMLVVALQIMLNSLGTELIVDGDCGELTEKEIKEFQKGDL